MQSLERRHIPALSDERAHLVENVNAPTLVGENVVATTGAISQGYGCLPHVDKQSLLVETIAFHRPPPKQWMFVIPGARIIIDLKKAPGILYVPANVYHATLPSGSGKDHSGIGSAIFTKKIVVGNCAKKYFML